MKLVNEPTGEDCLLCGAHQPPGHVLVRTIDGSRAGRVCSEHTLKEIILDSDERFLVEIEVSEAAFRITERVRMKRRKAIAKESTDG
jgi:hypothetical protein